MSLEYATWTEDGAERRARWQSESGAPVPRRLECVDDTLTADLAYRMTSEGIGLVWRGDFQNARQLLQAITRRVDKRRVKPADTLLDAFNQHRMRQAQRARTLGLLLIEVQPGDHIPLRRAPDVAQACAQAHGTADEPYLISLRELQGLIGAYEWRRNGVPIAALGGATLHPYYGVFSPVRGEYIDLVARAPLPAGAATALDLGSGTGVLAAVLARRGLQVLAVDQDPRALACTRDNLQRLGLQNKVEVRASDLYPDARFDLVVCNPPWLPARPSSPIEAAIYDPDSRMLRGFLAGLAAHLTPAGEGWLVMSNLAERIGLRAPEALAGWIAEAGLRVVARHDTRPTHKRALDPTDPLHAARSGEITTLWRLAAA